jgi:hypothetical protein
MPYTPNDEQKAALVMCLADASNNPRPNRMIKLLSDNKYTVDILAYPSSIDIPVRKAYKIEKPSTKPTVQALYFLLNIPTLFLLRAGFFPLAELIYEMRSGVSRISKTLPISGYSLVIVEDLQLLPFAFRRFSRNSYCKIIFDARELYTKQKENEVRFRLFEKPIRSRICQEYLRKCHHLLTVSPGLARNYMLDFGVEMQVIRSTPYFNNFHPRPTSEEEFRMVYHGLANPNRALKNMIEITTRLDNRFTLDLYLTGNLNHIAQLREQASKCSRICIRAPVPFTRIIEMLNSYDIGFYYLEPNGLNLTYSLPNKFFEFVQGRLALAIGPSPDMAEIVKEYGIGFIAPEFTVEAMVETLSCLTREKIDIAKENSDAAANDLCYERETKDFALKLGTL